jgi:hypothetical protein
MYFFVLSHTEIPFDACSTVYWDVAPYNLTDVHRRFGEVCYHHLLGYLVYASFLKDRSGTALRHIDKQLPNYTS